VENNRVVLCGQVVEIDGLRYTPAGVPLVKFKLSHTSEQTEGGISRKVECEVEVVALDQVGLAASRLKTGEAVCLDGFLARKHRLGNQLVLHVNKLKRTPQVSDVPTE
jgi:primosomal replication protein N